MADVKEIKEGFQKTEVGVIPVDWEILQLSEAVEFLDGQRRPVKASERAKVSGIYPYYGASGIIDFVNDYIFDDDLILLGEDGENILSRNLPLAFHVKGKIWVNNHAHVMKPKETFHIGFLTELLESLDYSLLNSGTAQPKLNQQTCRKIKVAKPPLSEQTAIATALNDADALIAQLEKLIAKKRAIKQGAMQKCLNPDLYDFHDEADLSDGKKSGKSSNQKNHSSDKWEVKKLGEIVLNISSGKSNTQSKEGHYPIYGSTGIIGWKDYYDYEGSKILVARVGANAGIVNKVFGKYCVSDNTLIITLKHNFDLNFIYFKLIYFQLNSLVFGSGQPLITGGQLKNIEFSIPLAFSEQTLIAQILSDMDAEIEVLEKKLEKYKKIKQGMMQELLTGKIRLDH